MRPTRGRRPLGRLLPLALCVVLSVGMLVPFLHVDVRYAMAFAAVCRGLTQPPAVQVAAVTTAATAGGGTSIAAAGGSAASSGRPLASTAATTGALWSQSDISHRWRPEGAIDSGGTPICQQHINVGITYVVSNATTEEAAKTRAEKWPRQMRTFLRSLLHHRTCNMTLQMMTNDRGLEFIVDEALAPLGIALAGPPPGFNVVVATSEPGLSVRFHNITEMFSVIQGLENKATQAQYVKAFLDEGLPADIDDIILVDVDMVLLDDICQLWRERVRLPCTEGRPQGWAPIQLPPEMSEWYYFGNHHHWDANITKDDFGYEWRGFNSGLVALGLNSLRQQRWAAVAREMMAAKGVVKLGDQDVYVHIGRVRQDLFALLSIEWNWQLVGFAHRIMARNRKALRDYGGRIRAVHGNAGTFGDMTNSIFCPLFQAFDDTKADFGFCKYNLPRMDADELRAFRDNARLLLAATSALYTDF